MPTDAAGAVPWCSEGVDRPTAQKSVAPQKNSESGESKMSLHFHQYNGAAYKSVIFEGAPDTCCINGRIITESEKNGLIRQSPLLQLIRETQREGL